ncbi:serine-rich adhesin for platelets-like [Anopheles nili]|uniref:serine-rich adhesin for platelets-like n=1 Tax=Anopheles nili TaxID=185578 RepID=UPI00237BA079|nr:serine-rich adhesin for platelets-like [Anopheles nili]
MATPPLVLPCCSRRTTEGLIRLQMGLGEGHQVDFLGPEKNDKLYLLVVDGVSNGSLVAHLSSVVGSQHAATTSQIQHQHQASIIAVQQLPSQSSVFPLTASINNKSPLSTTSAKLQPAEVLLLSTTVSDPTVVTTTVTSEKQQAIQHQLSLVSNSSQSASQLLITSSLADSNLMPPTPISVQPSAKQQQKHLLIRHQHQQHANDDLSGSLISVTSSHDSSHKSVFLNISAGSNGLCSSKTHLPPLSVVTNHSNSLGTNNKDEPSNSHHQQANVSLNENISSNIDVISGTNNGKSMNSNGNGKFSSLSVPSSHNSPPLKLAEPTGKNEIDLPLHVTTSALTSSTTVVTEAISTAGNMPCNIQSAMLHSGTLNTLTASTVPSVNVNNGSYTTPVVAAVTAAAHPSMIMTNGLSTLSPHFRAYPGYPLYSPYGNFPHNPYLPSSVTSPNLSPRLHPALTPIPHTLMGLGLMDARFPASLIAGSANNSSGSGRKSNDRDLSPLVQQQSSAAIATTVSSIANHQKVLPVTLNTISCSSNISLSLTCTSTTKGITSSNIGGTSGTSNSLLGSSNSGAIESGSISEQSLPQPSITTSINSNVGGGGNIIVSVRSQSPRGHSPNREKEGYSNIASSLSRSTPGPTILSSSGGGLAVAGSSTSIGSCTGAGPLGINPALSTTSAIVGGVVTYMPCLNVVSAAISTVSSSLTHPRTSLAIGGSIMSSSPAPSSSSSVGGVVVASEWLPNVVSNSQPTVTISSSSATVTTSIHNNSSSSASGAKTQQQHHHHTRPTPPPSSCSGFSSATDLSPASIPAYSASIPMSTTVSLSTPANTILYTPSVATPVVGGTQTLSITQPHPFSAESLFSTKVSEQADLLRRELDNRFLDRSGLTAVSTGPSYLRQELHHHQHQHTHLHQHQSLITGPTVGTPALFPPPLFKDVPKIGAVDSPFYRTGLGIASYPGYPPSLLHPGLSGPTQFVPTSHLQSFVPKQQTPPIDPNKKKTGKWNAMHVRIAWEIYHHQAKQNPDKAASIKAASDMLRPPSHMYPTTSSNAGNHGRVHDMPSSTFPPVGLPGRPGPYESNPLPPSFMSSPASHIGVSPFARYTSYAGSPFSSLSPFSRDIPIGSQISGSLHDPWRSALSRTVGSYSSGSQPTTGSWAPIKQDPNMVAESVRRDAEERDRQREREERERDRQRREREEREKQREREREEKLRKEQQERDRERERERERERKEKERRDMERREMERERLLHQQHRESKAAAVAAANAAVPVSRDRSPQRNGIDLDVRIKEEPRKDDEILLRSHVAAAAAAASDPRYHTSMMPHPYIASRHPASHMLPGSHLSRSMLPPSIGLPTHFSPHGSWGPDPFREYRLDPLHHPLRYNPLIDAYRAEEAKASLIYAAQTAAHFRGKGSSPVPPAQQQLPTSHLRLSSGIPSGGGSNACIPSGPNSGAPNATISVHSGTSMKAPLSTSTLSGSGTVGISSLNGNGGSGVGSAQTSPATLPSSVSSLSVELHKKDDICQIR